MCTGNICRSPIAERLTISYGVRLELSDLRVSSAGTRAVIGHPMHRDAAEVLKKLGGDESSFAARQLTPQVASHADLILTMTRAHRDSVLELVPRQLGRTFTLTEAAQISPQAGKLTDLAQLRAAGRTAPDITDPIGQSVEIFQAVGSQIAELLPPILELCRRS